MMADIPTISRTELAERRRKLRWQRRWRILQTSWQVVAMGGLTIGLIWVVTLPDWMLRDASQIEVEGNKFLSADTIRTLLPIKYPQFLLTLQPKTLTQRLESQAPIAEATVSRHLFPPGLTVRIQERYPVAIVYSSPTALPAQPNGQSSGQSSSQPNGQPDGQSGDTPTAAATPGASSGSNPVALLDERGTFIPYESYVALNRSRQLPNLKIIGMQDQYRSQWTSLYQQVSRSPVKILEIDWREPGNLILKTELGAVYCGSYGNRFAEQLRTLDQLRHLPEKLPAEQIDLIDLRNPQTPLVKLVGSEAIELPIEDAEAAGDEPLPEDSWQPEDADPQSDPP
ncbi:MAG: FtsQ-type POTRA domain-containing protein [Oscillatoriophycideae cyanobacterium NC_groundwater_1537_Pr4_S-0.65um_50_18]|nr:FtsQ-type POTRA domain-containing protein [Oscillatoriophycideae cyanobacterium NC_groundwater_1537_Pr4_S-0.65um_50_18]